jgi:hypothetical protein
VRLSHDLRDPTVEIDDDILGELMQVFPDTIELIECGDPTYRAYLSFIVKTLPQTPWPFTVGGLPFTIGDKTGNGRGPMFPQGTPGNMRVRMCQEVDAKTLPSTCASFRHLADIVTTAMHSRLPDLSVKELILDAHKRFHVVLGDDVNITTAWPQLPLWIAQCWTTYLHEKDLQRPDGQKARRAVSPDPLQGVVDNTPYDVLRPGVLVSGEVQQGAGERVVLSTTTGVLVKDALGNEFMTCSSHGVGDDRTLWQSLPTGDRRVIGEAILELSSTDIAIMQLSSGVRFENEDFESPGEDSQRLQRVLGESEGDRLYVGKSVYLNCPQTSTIPGMVMARGIKMVTSSPAHPAEDRHRYNIYNWVYVGQNEPNQTTSRIPDRACGSAIWDDEGCVVGFFRYYIEEGPWAGLYASISADEVVKAGYSLA